MPIKIPDSLPATSILESENIFVMTEFRAMHQDIRPLNVLILNLMPTKIVTETQLLRKLSNTPLQIKVEFLQMATHESTHVDAGHLENFYSTFDQVKNRWFDGMIITGAPLEGMAFEEVDYWEELCQIMEWSKKHVHCTMHICWGAFAGMYYHYGVPKYNRPDKLSGVYRNDVLKKSSPLFRGFDDEFLAPHSRATEFHAKDILAIPELELICTSEDAGVTIVKSTDSRHFFVTCHLEYDWDTLKLEYERDLAKGMNPSIPVHYFPDDDPTKKPVVRWRSAGQLLFGNWINYYVYQTTPYEIGNPDGVVRE